MTPTRVTPPINGAAAGKGSSMMEWIILFLVVSALISGPVALLIGFVCRSGAMGGVAMIDDVYDSHVLDR